MESDNHKKGAPPEVLYVYRCAACGHRAEVHFSDDSHDGEVMDCASCSAPVRIEWDGGVRLEVEGN